MTDDAKIVQVTLDGFWEMLAGDLKVGDVMRIHTAAGKPNPEVGGWAFVYRIAPERLDPMKGSVIPAIAVMAGAVVADTPSRTAKAYDGDPDPMVIEHYNYGIDEKVIEAAVRHVAELHAKRGGQDPPLSIPWGRR